MLAEQVRAGIAEAGGIPLESPVHPVPSPYRDRQEIAWHTGRRFVDMVAEDLKPSDVMTLDGFLNAIVVNSAIGGSPNAPIHLQTIARHLGVAVDGAD